MSYFFPLKLSRNLFGENKISELIRVLLVSDDNFIIDFRWMIGEFIRF